MTDEHKRILSLMEAALESLSLKERVEVLHSLIYATPSIDGNGEFNRGLGIAETGLRNAILNCN